jgi:uncharacterized protein YegP (UPF0339 family)
MGKFVLSARQGRYEFYFMAASGETIAMSPPHITRSAAQQALRDTRQSSPSEHLYSKKESEGKHWFELYSETGMLLVTSEKFNSAEKLHNAIDVMQREAQQSAVAEAL